MYLFKFGVSAIETVQDTQKALAQMKGGTESLGRDRRVHRHISQATFALHGEKGVRVAGFASLPDDMPGSDIRALCRRSLDQLRNRKHKEFVYDFGERCANDFVASLSASQHYGRRCCTDYSPEHILMRKSRSQNPECIFTTSTNSSQSKFRTTLSNFIQTSSGKS